jgi:hypothetical protein
MLSARLDGTGEIVIGPASGRAGFATGGRILYRTRRPAVEPPDDETPLLYTWHVVDGEETWTIRADDLECSELLVSASGDLVVFSCPGTPVHRVADGSLVRAALDSWPVGFDTVEAGLVVATWEPPEFRGGELLHVPLAGTGARFLARWAEPAEGTRWDYAP